MIPPESDPGHADGAQAGAAHAAASRAASAGPSRALNGPGGPATAGAGRLDPRGERGGPSRLGVAVAISVVAGLAAAAFVHLRRRQAEAENPPGGRIVAVDGLGLHYVERGEGRPLVLIHGNTIMGLDFLLSPLVDLAARRYRVIVPDRPGYGWSERPRGTGPWGPEAQARAIAGLMERIGARDAIVLGHSWGAMVAAALALERPDLVRGLVLAGGYLLPRPRLDIPLRAPNALPVVGDLMLHTVAPLLHRAVWAPLVRLLFAPAPVPGAFWRFPPWMAFRPSQLRASSAEMGIAFPAAWRLSRRYRDLTMPVAIVAGRDDRFVFARSHSEEVARMLPQADYRAVPGAGHMIHHSAPEAVMAAIAAADTGMGRASAGAAEAVPA